MTAPTDFPIPSDIEGFWMWDKMHCPKPQTTLTQDIFNSAISAGFTAGMEEFACPAGVVYRNLNTYAYMALVPQDLGDETIEQRVERYKGTLHEVLPKMGSLWTDEYLPSILPALESSMTRDYTALSDQQLIATLEQMNQEFTARYEVHGKINFVIASASIFVDFYNEIMDPEDATEAYEALQGFPTLSLDAGKALWALGRIVNKSSELSQLFERHEPVQLQVELAGSEIGRIFLQAFREYLEEWGWRSEAFELADPSWREDPTVPPEPSRDPDIIPGLGASPGTVQGTAKVVRSLAEASKLEKGDIMVCEMTMPPWMPLFSIAGAVVADTGGPLSHCAIVSREYKMPCVVGTVIGTAVITDGMTLTVDGAKGIVRIDSRG